MRSRKDGSPVAVEQSCSRIGREAYILSLANKVARADALALYTERELLIAVALHHAVLDKVGYALSRHLLGISYEEYYDEQYHNYQDSGDYMLFLQL